jgi:hypothetical protein
MAEGIDMDSILANILWIAGAVWLLFICTIAFLDARGKFKGNANKIIDFATKIFGTVVIIDGIMHRNLFVVCIFIVIVFRDDILNLFKSKNQK